MEPKKRGDGMHLLGSIGGAKEGKGVDYFCGEWHFVLSCQLVEKREEKQRGC